MDPAAPEPLRQRRLAGEWRALQLLAAANPETLRVEGRRSAGGGDAFEFVLLRTSGLLAPDTVTVRTHAARLLFPRFFPAMPIEAYLSQPVFHPNIDPQTGFVCLWSRWSAGDTVVNAVRRLQAIITWRLVCLDAPHVMQADAREWYGSAGRVALPLPCEALREPCGWREEREMGAVPTGGRRRLSECGVEADADDGCLKRDGISCGRE